MEVLTMQKTRSRSSSTYLIHRRWTAEDAREALAAQARSGLTLRAFAAREGLDAQRLDRWRRRLAADRAAPFVEIPRPAIEAAIPVAGAAGGPRERFEIVLGSGRVVRVAESFDANALRCLLEVVDSVRSC
jgi:transposase-like protein